MIDITNDNYEIYLLRYAEGELGPDDRRAVEQWLGAHPEAAAELALYAEAPRLEADPSVTFANPGRVQRRIVPLWPVALRWTAAAAVVAALMLPVALMDREAAHHTPAVVAAAEPVVVEAAEAADSTVRPARPMPARRPAARREGAHSAVAPMEQPANHRPGAYGPMLVAQAVDTLPAAQPEADEVRPEVQYVYTNALIAYEDSEERESVLPRWMQRVRDYVASRLGGDDEGRAAREALAEWTDNVRSDWGEVLDAVGSRRADRGKE